ncbi:MAG: cytochrome c biogenesis protein CcdA [Candidatus Omnitrophica bacterium]|nr:cytochrome c biogenesis protein CcdA [Candidatus Omnitrophota bacterium]
MDSNVSFGIAFAAGIFSFLSPCVLPLIPGYISFLSGVSLEELKKGTGGKGAAVKAGITSIFFVAGFSLVFVALGASASLVGKVLNQYMAIFTKIAGALIVLLGIHLTGLLNLGFLNYQKSFRVSKTAPGLFTAFIIGMAFGFGWTPCVGPLLAGILALAATQETMQKGIGLLFAYSMGIGIPFVATGFAVGAFTRFMGKYSRFIRMGEVVAGVFLIAIGTLIFFGNLEALLKYVPPVFYEFAK